MYEIKPLKQIDIDEFNEAYMKVKDVIAPLIKPGKKDRDIIIESYSYETLCEIENFLSMCDESPIQIILYAKVIFQTDIIEDKEFLDLFIAYKNEKCDEWFENCSLETIKILKNHFEKTHSQETFSDIYDYLLSCEKKLCNQKQI